MKILLIGKTGQLGGDLLRHNPGHEIYAPERKVLDIGSREAINSVIDEVQPDVVINTAAFHNLLDCESDPSSAFAVNCVAVRDLAAACARSNALFVTFSTDYVFGGEKRTPYQEDDKPSPIQMYGMSRLVGEHAALANAPDRSVVIRTCGLYGKSGAASKGGNFVDKRVQDAKHNKAVEMGCDQLVAPTSTEDLSKAVWQLVGHSRLTPGIYHLVNEGQCTWFEFTREIYVIMGFDVTVKPVDRGGLTGTMRRPLYSVLGNSKARRMGITLPPWRDALKQYLHGKYLDVITTQP